MSKQSKKNRPQLDGVIRSTNRRPVGGFSTKSNLDQPRKRLDDMTKRVSTDEPAINETKPLVKSNAPIDFSDIDEESKPVKRRFWFFKKKTGPKQPLTPARVVKKTMIYGGVAVLLIGSFLLIKLFLASQNIIDRNGDGAPALRSNVDPSALNGEGDGRVNVMLLGIGGAKHQAGDLADTIIVLSIDPIAKDAVMLSIPRDFYVDIPGFWSSRINSAHSIGEEQNYPGGGIALMSDTLEEVLDIPIHYYIRVDFDGFTQAVDAVGGIELDVKEPLYDTNFWWQYGILDISAGRQFFDGEKALYYARSRLTSPRGDFDRGDRQREILIAVKDKALSLGTFANPIKLASLIDAAGGHVKTNLQISELLRLYEIASEIQQSNIASVGLTNAEDSFLASQTIDGASVQVPKSGSLTELQEFVRSLFVDGFIRSEAANVDVLNGSGIASLGLEKAEELKSYGYQIQTVAVAPTSDYKDNIIIDLSNGENPFTKRYLEQRFGVSAQSGDALPKGVTTTADFVIIIGSNAAL